MEEKLKKIGQIIFLILVLTISVQFLLIWNKYCDVGDIGTSAKCIEEIILLLIPTEVTIVELLSPFPFILILVLLFYWRYIDPPRRT